LIPHDCNDSRVTERVFSGRFPVRMPRYLHQKLTEVARQQGVSLNQFMCTAAAMAAGLSGQNVQETHAPGSHRVSDEEYDRIWRNTFR
jgi:HicB-like protein involved in pilus formation